MQHAWDTKRFDTLYRDSADPWSLQASWYEQRKRSVVLASLTQPRYRHAFEPGCAQGLLTQELAARCDRVLAGDCSAAAVALAQQRVGHLPHVAVRRAVLPNQWPGCDFDLIVLSELLYYLDPAALAETIGRLRAATAPPGTSLTVLACHWRHPIEGCPLRGDQVHERLCAGLPWPRACSVRDADFMLDVWVSGARGSLAQREGRI